MTTVIGIDEAGYGPSLGPLVVGSAAFRADDDLDLWTVLDGAVAKQRRGSGGKVLVADSKAVYAQGRGLDRLERAVLAFMGSGDGTRPARFVGLIEALCEQSKGALDVPWWDDLALPVATTPEELGRAIGLLDEADGLSRFLGLAAQIVPADAFNRLVDHHGNKATLLFQQNMALVHRALRRYEGDLTFLIDKHGGRHDYAPLLANNFFGRSLREDRVSPGRSSYTVALSDRRLRFHFIEKADASHLPPALASMTCKYLRELCMKCFNAYWCGRVDGLKPTAGYAADGKRFIAAIRPFLSDEQARAVIRQR